MARSLAGHGVPDTVLPAACSRLLKKSLLVDIIRITFCLEKFMKKILTILAAAIMSAAIATADTVFIPHVYGGFGLGTKVDGDLPLSEEKQNYADSWIAGLGMELNVPMGTYFGVQSGLNFFINNYAVDDNLTGQLRYYSLDIPLLLTCSYGAFNLVAGPYASIPIGKIRGSKDLDGDKINSDTKINFGVTAGLGFERKMGAGRCLVEARYLFDLLPMKDGDGNDIFTRRGLLLDFGYKVPLLF